MPQEPGRQGGSPRHPPPGLYFYFYIFKYITVFIIAILLQVLFPFTVAGMGMVAAGFVFDYVDKWHVFKEISEIIVMIPALLGLKGNLACL